MTLHPKVAFHNISAFSISMSKTFAFHFTQHSKTANLCIQFSSLFAHLFTSNSFCPSWISGRERMRVENIDLNKRMLPDPGAIHCNSWSLLGCASDWATEAQILLVKRGDLDYMVLNPCPAEPGYTLFCKQCRSRSVGFFRSQLIWICTVCHQVCKFIKTVWIK